MIRRRLLSSDSRGGPLPDGPAGRAFQDRVRAEIAHG